MIEVEKKFLLTESQKSALIKDAVFTAEKHIEDSYFDTADFALSTKDWWLRRRGERFELKIPIGDNVTRTVDQYEELETDAEIRKALGMPEGKDLKIDLERAGYLLFCHCVTTRQKYSLGDFHIDLDAVRYDNGDIYQLAEIELMVAEAEVSRANKKLYEMAARYGLEDRVVRGKVIEYLFRYKPEHFKALESAGVIRPKKD